MAKDLTYGKPISVIFYFSLPMLIGNIFQQLYNIVDSIIVGNFVGSDALAAVGASFPIVFLSVSVASGLSMGASVVISQQFGAKKISDMKTTIFSSLIGLIIIAFIVMFIGAFAAKPLLRLLKTPDNIIIDSSKYLEIYFMGAIFLFLYNTLTAIYNALGDSKSPLIFLICATIINVVLDYTFVVYFEMGVTGVAWATLIAQGISSILSFYFLMKKLKDIKEDKPFKYFEKEAVKKIAKVGIPSMIQQSLVSVSMMAMQGLVNSYGSNFIAGYTAATKIDTIAMMPTMNISNALSTFVAQNIGAGKVKRVKEGYKSALLITFIFCLAITAVVYIFGENLINIFMDSDKNIEVINYGVEYMRVVSVFYIVMGIMFASNSVLRGSGDMQAFLISSLFNLITRVLGAYALSKLIGQSAIWWSIPIGWSVGAIIAIIRFLSGKWKDKKITSIDDDVEVQQDI